MKLNKKNIFVVLALLIPIWAYADVHTGVELKKDATYDYTTQTGVITLENFVGQVTKKMNTGKSADVVLVVDGSRSMNAGGQYGMDALHEAVGKFATELKNASEKDGTGGIEHRLSVIIFAGNCKLLCDFTSVESKTVAYFKDLISTACGWDDTHVDNYGSGTMAHMALGLASYVMTGSQTIANTAIALSTNNTNWSASWILPGSWSHPGARTGTDCNRYVVLMTDGALEGTPLNASGGSITGSYKIPHSDETNNKHAEDQAVKVAELLKKDATYKSSVYSIGFLSESEAIPGLNNYLNNVSSNHLSAPSGTFDSDNPSDKIPHDYYIRVDRTGGDLGAIFELVSEEIAAGCAAVDLASAVVNDVINGKYFKLPDDVTATNLKDKITVYTLPCKSYEQTSSGPVYEFDETKKNKDLAGNDIDLLSGLSFSLTDANPDPNITDSKITVSGFDFTEYWCGLEYQSASKPKVPHGYKLVIEIPFTVNNYSGAIGEVPTNTTGSGFSGTVKNGGGTLDQNFGTPAVDLYELTISRANLKAGESAVYTLTSAKDPNFHYSIVLTGTGSGTVSQKVLYVPDGNVTATETGWGWANTPTSSSISKEIGTPDSAHPTLSPNPTYYFSGTPTGDKNPEDYKDNRFK